MQFPGLMETRYIDNGLPEVIWIGLLTNKYGYRRGIELATELGKIAFAHRGTTKHVNFALASSYSALAAEAKRAITETAAQTPMLAVLQNGLEPLLTLYRGCPLEFLGLPEQPRARELLVAAMKTVVGQHFDKYRTPALVSLACVLYIRSVNGGLFFTQDVPAPDLNALVDDPDSEAAQRAASFVRATVLNEFGRTPRGDTPDWPGLFWNQGLQIDGCFLGSQEEAENG
jgi:hypothetical protein